MFYNSTSQKRIFNTLLYHCLLNAKKSVQNFGLKTWRTKEPFGCRVVHHMLINFLRAFTHSFYPLNILIFSNKTIN